MMLLSVHCWIFLVSCFTVIMKHVLTFYLNRGPLWTFTISDQILLREACTGILKGLTKNTDCVSFLSQTIKCLVSVRKG